MIGFSEEQIMAWLSPIIWPFLRVLAMFTVAPIFSQKAITTRARIGFAFFIAFCAQATLIDQPTIAINDPRALGAVVQQVAVGLSIGFAARLIITALEIAGEMVGLQMGLNFASFFDPASNAQLSAVSRFLVQVFTLFFIVTNGHLLIIMAVIKSFEAFPVDGYFLESLNQMRIFDTGALIFSSALWIALPMMVLLLFVNFTMGIISRIAPQLNIFAIGFPITLTIGMLGLLATLPSMQEPFLRLIDRMIGIFGA